MQGRLQADFAENLRTGWYLSIVWGSWVCRQAWSGKKTIFRARSTPVGPAGVFFCSVFSLAGNWPYLTRCCILFEGECFEEFDEVVDFGGSELAGFPVLIFGVGGGEDVVESGGASVVQVGGAAIDSEERGCVIARPHEF